MMSLDTIAIIIGLIALILWAGIIYLGLQRAKRRDLRREARQMDRLVERNKPKAIRVMGGSRGPERIVGPQGRERLPLSGRRR